MKVPNGTSTNTTRAMSGATATVTVVTARESTVTKETMRMS